jgi:hypothetical protein
MKFAYADPPYLGCGKALYGAHHQAAGDWDRLETHLALIERLSREFDGWAYSLHEPSLRAILPHCPEGVRTCPWVKPFASFKPGVTLAHAWEPVLLMPARSRDRDQPTVRDWVAANITMQRGLPGAKPEAFCFWLFDAAGLEPTDEFVDLFPGTGAVSRAWAEWCARPVTQDGATQCALFASEPTATTND